MKAFSIKHALWLGMVLLTSRVAAAANDDFRMIADRVFAAVVAELEWLQQDSLGFKLAPENVVRFEKSILQNKSFGTLCAEFAENDFSRARFHWRGKTILEQLRPLRAAMLAQAWREHGVASAFAAPNTWPAPRSAELANQNVVANYLLHHYLALRFAKFAGEAPNRRVAAWQRALIYEAMAQGYLANAFSAGHLLAPMPDALAALNHVNFRQVHNFFGNTGVFVINSRGEAWRTFGEKLLQWYAPTGRAVFEAAQTSVRELFIVYFAAVNVMPVQIQNWARAPISSAALLQSLTTPQDGEKYCSTLQFPTLQLLPMPVAASWSVRTDRLDTLGVYHRHQYPQLRETAFHDPDDQDLDKEFLYARAAVLDTMIPAQLRGRDVAEVIKSHPDVASVRYIQQRNFPPSYVGLLLSFGGGKQLNGSEKNVATSLGFGYGFIDDFLLFKRIDANLALWRYDSRRVYLAPTMGTGFKAGRLIETLHFAAGYAWGVRSPNKAHGFVKEISLETPTIPLGFTYSGVTLRLKYQTIALEKRTRVFFLELVWH